MSNPPTWYPAGSLPDGPARVKALSQTARGAPAAPGNVPTHSPTGLGRLKALSRCAPAWQIGGHPRRTCRRTEPRAPARGQTRPRAPARGRTEPRAPARGTSPIASSAVRVPAAGAAGSDPPAAGAAGCVRRGPRAGPGQTDRFTDRWPPPTETPRPRAARRRSRPKTRQPAGLATLRYGRTASGSALSQRCSFFAKIPVAWGPAAIYGGRANRRIRCSAQPHNARG